MYFRQPNVLNETGCLVCLYIIDFDSLLFVNRLCSLQCDTIFDIWKL
jgi:hypothetical protein